ncbi:MAG: hypothetical protein NTX13_04390 [Acidobacteria bacterium]|nr:hypothetical protein [Acidobacteriota bacterium]
MSTDYDVFLKDIGCFETPTIVLWHEIVAKAFPLLSRLVTEGSWPNHLRGVVFFRAAQYAGLNSRVHANEELERYSLPASKVHVLSSVVSSRPDPEIVNRIRNFVEAVRKVDAGGVPYWILEPPEISDGVFTPQILDFLMEKGGTVEDPLQGLNWNLIVKDCALQGVECGPVPSVDVLREVANKLRSRIGSPRVRCGSCSALRAWEHTRLRQMNLIYSESGFAEELMKACHEVRQLAETASHLATDAVVEATARLAVFDRGKLVPILENLIGQAFEQNCILVQEQKRIFAALYDAEIGLRGGQDPSVLATRLATFIECKTLQGEIDLHP